MLLLRSHLLYLKPSPWAVVMFCVLFLNIFFITQTGFLLCAFVKAIKTYFVLYPKCNKNKCNQRNRKAKQINQRCCFVAKNVSPCCFEIIFKHNDSSFHFRLSIDDSYTVHKPRLPAAFGQEIFKILICHSPEHARALF